MFFYESALLIYLQGYSMTEYYYEVMLGVEFEINGHLFIRIRSQVYWVWC